MGAGSSEKLIFLHIIKTAGTSFMALLERQYPGARMYRLRGLPGAFAGLDRRERETYQIVCGHFHFGIHQLFDSPSRYLTFIRDPIERAISHFTYIQWRTSEEFHERINASRLSLEQWVRLGVGPAVDNLQVRRLTLRENEFVPFKQTTRGMLDEAKRVLAERISFLGITERYEDSVRLFAEQLGWREPLTIERLKASPNRKAAADLSASERAAIVEHNAMDLELYAFAVDLFQRRLAASAARRDPPRRIAIPPPPS